MKMKFALLIIGLLTLQFSFAQDKGDTAIREASVVVKKDPRVDVLVKKQSAVNASIKKSSVRSGRGYRLLVVNTNKRDEAIDAKTKIYTHYPELKSYLTYQSPFFKVKAGNFKSRAEAEKHRKTMSIIFPKGVFIINDTIEIKPEKEKEEEL
jgi:hypothetical protein